MDINTTNYLNTLKQKSQKGPPHQKAEIVNLFLDFIGGAIKDYPYTFWLKRVGRCTYGDAIAMMKDLENLPVKYNKAGVIINKLKKINASK